MILGLSMFAWAQSPEFTPVAQVRPRVEAHTGRDGIAQDGNDIFVSQRTRLGVIGKLGDVSAKLLLQDVRVWGEETHTLFDSTANRFDLHEGYLEVALAENAGVRVGRQEIALQEHRLIGTVGWTQQARSFDAVRAFAGKTGVNGELAFAILGDPTEAVPPAPVAAGPRPYQQLGIARVGWAAEKKSTLVDAVYILQNSNSDDGNDGNDGTVHTTGIYAKGAKGILSGRVEGYAQLGGMGGNTRAAWMTGVSGTLAPNLNAKPKITLWYDHLSGDGDLTDGTDSAFDTLFDTRHKFYGLMDVMNFGVGGRADGRGLQDAALKLAMQPVEGLTTKLDSHLFLPSAAQGGDGVIGEELDLTVAYKWKDGLKVQGGASSLFRPNLDADFWGYLQVDATL